MRPAQIAREILARHIGRVFYAKTSMRPAQIAREIRWAKNEARKHGQTSMRPAQIAREIPPAQANAPGAPTYFNEARANCAGNSEAGGAAPNSGDHFNEARANCAGNSRHPPPLRRARDTSMRPAQIAREIVSHPHGRAAVVQLLQ